MIGNVMSKSFLANNTNLNHHHHVEVRFKSLTHTFIIIDNDVINLSRHNWLLFFIYIIGWNGFYVYIRKDKRAIEHQNCFSL